MDTKDQPIPEGYRLLKEHNVDPFKSTILGSTLGTLCDAGLTDSEILTVCGDFLRIIRAVVADPAAMNSNNSLLQNIKRIAEQK